MGIVAGGGGGGGGAGFALGPPQNVFTNVAALTTYTADAANAAWLAIYDGSLSLFVQVGTDLYHRVNSAWVELTPAVQGPKGDTGAKGDESRYVVADANNTQTGAAHVLTITGYTVYTFGDQMVFKIQNSVNPATHTLQVNSLDVKKLLKNDGEEFQQAELRQGVQITATYDGTNFVSDYKEEPQFHTVFPSSVTVVGDLYAITDNDIKGFGVTPSQMLFLQAKGDNTGPLQLSVNSSTLRPVVLSDGSPIPAGALQDGQPMLLIWDSGNNSWRITNLQPARGAKGTLIATYAVPTGNYTAGLQHIPGGLVLQNANVNVWTPYWDLKYEGVLASDPTKVLYGGGDGWNFYFNSVNEVWRQPVGPTLADGVWEDVDTGDVSDMLDSRYPSDAMAWEWLGAVADEAAANAAVADVDDLTMLPIAYFGGDVHVLSGRSNAAGYKVLDRGFEDVDRRSEIEAPVVNPNEGVTGMVVEVLHAGSVVGRSFMLAGYLGFGDIVVDLDDGTAIDLSARGSSNYMTIYLGARANNANVGAGDNVQMNIYEWG